MRVACLHGYFMFREDFIGEVAQFNSYYGLDLVAKDDYYTFDLLSSAPIYSVRPLLYLGVATTKTYCGDPWEVMRENGLVYDFLLKMLRPITSVTVIANYQRARSNWLSQGLIMPGSITEDWGRITGYNGAINVTTLDFSYGVLFYD